MLCFSLFARRCDASFGAIFLNVMQRKINAFERKIVTSSGEGNDEVIPCDRISRGGFLFQLSFFFSVLLKSKIAVRKEVIPTNLTVSLSIEITRFSCVFFMWEMNWREECEAFIIESGEGNERE